MHSSNTNDLNVCYKSTDYKSNVSRETSETNHLKYISGSNLNKLIFALLKFESVVKDISSSVDLLMLSETKMDDKFPKGQFLIKGFGGPFRIDRNVKEATKLQ